MFIVRVGKMTFPEQAMLKLTFCYELIPQLLPHKNVIINTA